MRKASKKNTLKLIKFMEEIKDEKSNNKKTDGNNANENRSERDNSKQN